MTSERYITPVGQKLIEESVTARELSRMDAEAIENYWHEKGFPEVWAKVKRESFPVDGKYLTNYKVISNLVSGLPPKGAA